VTDLVGRRPGITGAANVRVHRSFETCADRDAHLHELGVLAVELYHFFGWKGMLAFPFIVLALIWVGKIFIGKLIKRFALGLFSMKSGVLRGASMTVHSIASVPKPSEFNDADEYEERGEFRPAFGIHASGNFGPPEMHAAQVSHDDAADHDVMKVRDDEVSVGDVNINAQRGQEEPR